VRQVQVFNGAIECIHWWTRSRCRGAGDRRDSLALPAVSDGAQIVANRLRRTCRQLRAGAGARPSVLCACGADLPEYSAAIDVYHRRGDATHVPACRNTYADIPEVDQRRRLSELLAAARDVLAVPREQIALKTRAKGRGGSKYGQFDTRGEFVTVREGEARLRVNLFDYLDTGWFLDHRPMRLRIAAEAEDTRFLNLFGYTGAATVHAAVGRARQTTTVDLSGRPTCSGAPTTCGRIPRQAGHRGAKHRWCRPMRSAGCKATSHRIRPHLLRSADVLQLKRAEDFDVRPSMCGCCRLAVARLARDGVLYFSNNFRRFRLDEAAVARFADCTEISATTIPRISSAMPASTAAGGCSGAAAEPRPQ
jgi:23S rRNA (guanine2445-N2)-methyltransferase / 23S rRNA (guanine2069-N7)-methyltransferase